MLAMANGPLLMANLPAGVGQVHHQQEMLLSGTSPGANMNSGTPQFQAAMSAAQMQQMQQMKHGNMAGNLPPQAFMMPPKTNAPQQHQQHSQHPALAEQQVMAQQQAIAQIQQHMMAQEQQQQQQQPQTFSQKLSNLPVEMQQLVSILQPAESENFVKSMIEMTKQQQSGTVSSANMQNMAGMLGRAMSGQRQHPATIHIAAMSGVEGGSAMQPIPVGITTNTRLLQRHVGHQPAQRTQTYRASPQLQQTHANASEIVVNAGGQ
jgi:hypothetical protein